MVSSSKAPRYFFSRGIMPLLVFVVLSMLVFTVSRTGLAIWQPNDTQGHFFDIYIQGLRTDFSIICTMYSPALLLLLGINLIGTDCGFLKRIIAFLLSLVLTTHVMIELATPPFILEYGVRPNQLFVDYLVYPKEVIKTLIGGHLFALIFSVVAGIITFIASFTLASGLFKNYVLIARFKAATILVCALFICAFGIRSTTGHRPLNPSMLSFGNDPMANDLPVNSSFKVFYALRHYGENDLNEGQLYAYDDDENIIEAARKISLRQEPLTEDKSCPINQVITPKFTGRGQRNIVVVLEESMGADFVESLGGLPLTPELEKIARQGWAFTNMFAAGHRSVRGIEAITAGFPPSPLASQVKLEHTSPITTIMQIYKELGYETSFIYGGESHFDNMRTYFLYNGAKEVIEQKDYENPSFVASWGVSDEDLFAKADETFARLYKEGKPFCSVVFSSSFHDPFDIPQGKVDIDGIRTDEPLRMAAVKYADYALGKFIAQAKTQDYYKDTIFVIIADHESRVQSNGGFPADKFLIPAVILSPDLKPFKDDRIVNQIDILPTVLSLSGVSGEFPLVGQDLTRKNTVERALMDYNELFGVRLDNHLEVLMPGLKSVSYKVSADKSLFKKNKALTLTGDDEDFLELGQALENLGLAIYKNRWNDFKCVKNLRQQ